MQLCVPKNCTTDEQEKITRGDLTDEGKKKRTSAEEEDGTSPGVTSEAPPTAPPPPPPLPCSGRPLYLKRTEELRDDVERVDSGMNSSGSSSQTRSLALCQHGCDPPSSRVEAISSTGD